MSSIPIKDGSGTTQNARVVNNGTDIVPQQGRAAQPAASGNTNTASANTAVVVTLAAAGASIYNILAGVYWSYSGGTPAGSIKIEDVSGTTVFQADITAAGPGFFMFDPPIRNAVANHALIITLAAAGSGVIGKLSVHAWTETI